MAEPPAINPHWLTHPADRVVTIVGFKRAREMFAQKSMAPVLIGPETLLGNATATDEQILDYPFERRVVSNVIDKTLANKEP